MKYSNNLSPLPPNPVAKRPPLSHISVLRHTGGVLLQEMDESNILPSPKSGDVFCELFPLFHRPLTPRSSSFIRDRGLSAIGWVSSPTTYAGTPVIPHRERITRGENSSAGISDRCSMRGYMVHARRFAVACEACRASKQPISCCEEVPCRGLCCREQARYLVQNKILLHRCINCSHNCNSCC